MSRSSRLSALEGTCSGSTYRVHPSRAHFSRTALASPGGSRTVIGFPVIWMVCTPLIQTCPVTLAAPQASVALMKSAQWAPGVTPGPLISSLAVLEQALVGRAVVIGDKTVLVVVVGDVGAGKLPAGPGGPSSQVALGPAAVRAIATGQRVPAGFPGELLPPPPVAVGPGGARPVGAGCLPLEHQVLGGQRGLDPVHHVRDRHASGSRSRVPATRCRLPRSPPRPQPQP